MAQDVYVNGNVSSVYLDKAKRSLQSAKNTLQSSISYNSLVSLKFEDGGGSKVLFSSDLASQVSDLAAKVDTLSTKLASYSQQLNTGTDAMLDIDTEYSKKFDPSSTLLSILSKAGFFGGILGPAIKLFTSEKSGFSGGVSALKDLSKILKTGSKWYESSKNLKLISRTGINFNATRIKRLFGLNNILPTYGTWSSASSWSTRFYNNWHKQAGLFDGFTSGGKKAVLQGAGVVLDLFANGCSNYDEYKRGDISAGRAVAETLVETGVDFVKDWAIGAAVTAGVAATIGSAPVLVVGVATVAVSAGLDWASKKITYALTGEAKGVTELVSDALIDGTKAVAKAAKNAGKKIASVVKNALPKIKVPKLGSLFG